MLRGAAERASKISVGVSSRYTTFDEQIEAILPHTWLNPGQLAKDKIKEEAWESNNPRGEKTFPRSWIFRQKKKWDLDDSQLATESLGEPPGGLIQTSSTQRQVDLRKKILVTTGTLKDIRV